MASPFIISACSQGNLYLARVPFEDNDDIFYAVGSFSFRPATEAECNGKTQIMEHVHIRLDLLSKVSASRFSHCSCGLKTARSAPSPSGAQVLCRFTSFFFDFSMEHRSVQPSPSTWRQCYSALALRQAGFHRLCSLAH